MSLQTRLSALISAVGTDIKDLRNRATSYGAFRVGLTSAFSVDTTLRVLTFSRTSTNAFDVANWWTTATGKHTPQKAGRWKYQCNIRFASTPTSKIWPQIFKNGTLVAIAGPFYVGGSANSGLHCEFPSILMNGTTDFVEIKINADAGSWALSVDDTTNWIAGEWIGGDTPYTAGGAVGTGQRARVYRSATMNLTSGGSEQKISMDAVESSIDNDGMFDSANGRLVCRTAGAYEMNGGLSIAPNASGIRQAWIKVNGVQKGINQTQSTGAGASTRVQVTAGVLDLAVGDTIELFGFQDSGSTLAVNVSDNAGRGAWLSAVRVG